MEGWLSSGLKQYNQLLPSMMLERTDLLHKILGKADENTFINKPFHCDFGKHIRVGKRFFANFNWTVLDEAYVTIGAGSVVVKDIPDNSIAVGNPARVIKP